MTEALRLERISKRFPGVLALDNVSFQVHAGEIHALCGENGAGKSTLIKVLAGIHPHGSYSGTVYREGTAVTLHNVDAAERVGIAVVHQELAMVPDLSVAENLFLGKEPHSLGIVSQYRMQAAARDLLQTYHIDISPTDRVGNLSTGMQQLVEIVRALGKKPRILVLDEPSAALTETEVAVLLDIIKDLREKGIGIVYISHKLSEVFAIADHITVLRDGTTVASRPAADYSHDSLIADMVGRNIANIYPEAHHQHGQTILSVTGLSACQQGKQLRLENISFDVQAGEILGIGGLMGSGRSETLLHLMGAWGQRTAGNVTHNGRPWHPKSPRQAIDKGMVLVSEDRKGTGLLLEQTIDFNLSLASLRSIGRWITNRHAEHQRNQHMAQQMRVKAPDLGTSVGTLSGGNQQKVVIGKALLAQPQIILLDEPTRGIDVGAKQEIYRLLHELCAQGLAVIMVSSELPELLGLSDRIVMLSEGRVGGIFKRADVTQEKLMHAAVSGHVDAVEQV